MSKDFVYKVDPDFDYTIDEKGNTFIALRKIDWGDTGSYKLDLRKYYSTDKGEQMNRGVSFLTEDGPHELTKVLIEKGYGDPSEITDTIIYNRPDILGKLCRMIDSDPSIMNKELWEDEEEEKYYDPEELIS